MTRGTRTRSQDAERGAALLLSVYIAALTLLLLGGVSIQRSSTEMRAAELSRDLQQAFFAAEAGLDQALVRSDLPDGIYTITLPDGSRGQYSVMATRTEILSPRQKLVTRQVTTAGTSAAGRQETVAGYYTQTASLIGAAYANSNIEGAHPNPQNGAGGCGSFVTEGSLHTGKGTVGSVKFINNSGAGDGVPRGRVTVGPPDPDATKAYKDLWGIATRTEIKEGNMPAILLSPAYARIGRTPAQQKFDLHQRFGGSFEGFPKTAFGVMELPPIKPISTPAPYAAPLVLRDPWTGKVTKVIEQATAVIATQSGDVSKSRIDIYDGDPWDVSGRGDGKIVMRLKHMEVWPDTKVVFHAPAQLYIEDAKTLTPDWITSPLSPLPPKNIPTAAYIGKGSAVVAVNDADGRTIRNGVEVLVTVRKNTFGSPIEPGAVLVDGPGVFFGNIWAPESKVEWAGASYPDHPNPPPPGQYTDGAIGSFQYNVCPTANNCPGTLMGVETGYLVANELYVQGDLRVGASKHDPFATEQERQQNSARPALTGWSGVAVK